MTAETPASHFEPAGRAPKDELVDRLSRFGSDLLMTNVADGSASFISILNLKRQVVYANRRKVGARYQLFAAALDVAHDRRDPVETSPGGGPPPALPCDELIGTIGQLADQNGLQNADLSDRSGQ